MYVKDLWGGLLTAKAHSAGGVVVGAAMNRQPGLFDNVVFRNAFIDLYASSLNRRLPLTEHEWEEYGNPVTEVEDEKRIRFFCPLWNMGKAQSNYPNALITGTLDDANVPYWNATLLARALPTSINHVLLNIEQSGGHNLTGTKTLQVSAMEAAFILRNSYE